jgi:hypothetical protein
MKLSEEQNIAYEESLLADRLKQNQVVIDALISWIPQKEEEERLNRIEYLNTLNASQRREYIYSKSNVKVVDTVKYLNMSNEDVSKIDPNMLIIYNIDNQYPFVYALDVLYKNQKIVCNDSNEILYINLPILINNQEYNYYIPNTDTQLEFDLLSSILFPSLQQKTLHTYSTSPNKRQCVDIVNDYDNNNLNSDNNNSDNDNYEYNDNLDNLNSSTYKLDPKEEIKLLTFNKLAQLGIDFTDLNTFDEVIDSYLESGYTYNEISEKLIQNVLEEDIIN